VLSCVDKMMRMADRPLKLSYRIPKDSENGTHKLIKPDVQSRIKSKTT